MNELLLRAIMREHHDSSEELAKALGIHPHTLYLKMRDNEDRQFTQDEIRIIVNRYGLTPNDTMRIFFNDLGVAQ